MTKENAKTKNEAGAGIFLRFLYRTVPGRAVLRVLTSRKISAAAGKFLDSPLSRPLIKPFVRKNGIDLREYESENFCCFNDCFSRKIKEGKRPFSRIPGDLCSPCDGLLSVYEIDGDTVLPVKQSAYTVKSLLGDERLAESFAGGVCAVIRLCVHNYHRYSFFDSGRVIKREFIPGRLHTVRPIALEEYPVFTENCREYTVMETENFGKCVFIEVGAMLVGKIANRDVESFSRGEEKGTFLYGGSTVILLFEKDRVKIADKFLSGGETPVKMGETLN